MRKITVDHILIGVMGICLGALVVVLGNTIEQRVIGVGDKAPSFTVRTETGEEISRSRFGGKLLVLNFWATWCPPCVEELPSLKEFHKQFAGEGVVVLGISVDENERAYREFLRQHEVTFPTSRDPEANISSRYGTYKYPETYIINAEGRVVQKIIGPTLWTDPELVRQIRSLL